MKVPGSTREKNSFIEMVLWSTHNNCFDFEKRKIRFTITYYYNHATSNLAIYSHETSQDKLSEA